MEGSSLLYLQKFVYESHVRPLLRVKELYVWNERTKAEYLFSSESFEKALLMEKEAASRKEIKKSELTHMEEEERSKIGPKLVT